MTPFPGTPVYNKLKEEGRLLTDDWSLFDMTNVTFIPKTMSPWKLQKEFFRSTIKFYSFASSFKIMRSFGLGYGMRRLGLWLTLSLGLPLGYFAASRIKSMPFYKLKHFQNNPQKKKESVSYQNQSSSK